MLCQFNYYYIQMKKDVKYYKYNFYNMDFCGYRLKYSRVFKLTCSMKNKAPETSRGFFHLKLVNDIPIPKQSMWPLLKTFHLKSLHSYSHFQIIESYFRFSNKCVNR